MFKIEGLDEFNRKLKDMERRMQGLDGQHSVPLGDLFPPEFMRSYTDFGSIDEMFEASGFKVDSEEDLSNIPDDEWDNFVARRTRFASWEEMIGTAGQAWTAQKLGL